MTVKPIIFSAPMVRAIIESRKTQTRRLQKGVPEAPSINNFVHELPRHATPYLDSYCGARKSAENPRGMSEWWCWWTRDDRPCEQFKVKYVPGDFLWVRETWAPLGALKHNDPATTALIERGFYRADKSVHDDEIDRWTPAIHMPRVASRLTLEVGSVKVERLQEISDADALTEGVSKIKDHCYIIKGFGYDTAGLCHSRPTIPFAILWQHLNGEESWEANPYVVAVTFKAHQCNVDDFLKQREAA